MDIAASKLVNNQPCLEAGLYYLEAGLYYRETGLYYRETGLYYREAGLYYREAGLYYREAGLRVGWDGTQACAKGSEGWLLLRIFIYY